MAAVDYERARALLDGEFASVEEQALGGIAQVVAPPLVAQFDAVFSSRTQAYREVLLGCVLVRLLDKNIDVHKPYVNQGTSAYNGRTLDERVVNPFLQQKRVPCSRGPYLAAFRRSVEFRAETREGLRDKSGFDALLALIDRIAGEDDDSRLTQFLRYLLFRFLELRSQAVIPLMRLQRTSLEQYDALIAGILSTPSGGRFPCMLVGATFATLKGYFALDWEIEFQGINVADRAAGAAGDIVVRSKGAIVLAAEVTERAVDKHRVVVTFQTKIAPNAIEDYLFFIKGMAVNGDARAQAQQYFSQGHEVNFLEIANWIRMVLATVGKRGRMVFNAALLDALSAADVPSALRVAWNEQIAKLTTT